MIVECDQRLLASKVSTVCPGATSISYCACDQRLLASKVSTGKFISNQLSDRGVINAYWHQRFQQFYGVVWCGMLPLWSTPTGIKGFNRGNMLFARKHRNGDQRLLASKVSTVPPLGRDFENPSSDQRLLASKVSTAWDSVPIPLAIYVINAYWHQRFQQYQGKIWFLHPFPVINAYWHQRFQQSRLRPWLALNRGSDQRLLASKVSTACSISDQKLQ